MWANLSGCFAWVLSLSSQLVHTYGKSIGGPGASVNTVERRTPLLLLGIEPDSFAILLVG
jgi:hypothetical protein